MFGLFNGLDTSNPSSPPTSKLMYELGLTNTQYLIDEVIKDPSATFRVFFLVKDLLKNGGT